LPPSLLLLASRHHPEADLKVIDAKIREKYQGNKSAMMFEFEVSEVEAEFGAEEGMELKFKALQLIRPAFEKRSIPVYKFEGDLWLFKNTNDALETCLEMQRILEKFNKTCTEEHK